MTGCYRTLCNTGNFRTRGIFRTQSNIYNGKFYSQSCVIPAYLEPRHIQNTAKHLPRNILLKTFCNPETYRNLAYSALWFILKSNHNQNPVEYLRWNFLLRTLRSYIRFTAPTYLKLPHIQNRCLSATP